MYEKYPSMQTLDEIFTFSKPVLQLYTEPTFLRRQWSYLSTVPLSSPGSKYTGSSRAAIRHHCADREHCTAVTTATSIVSPWSLIDRCMEKCVCVCLPSLKLEIQHLYFFKGMFTKIVNYYYIILSNYINSHKHFVKHVKIMTDVWFDCGFKSLDIYIHM